VSGYLSLANGAAVVLHNGFVLGRVGGCDLVIDDGKASRRHAKFHVEAGVVEIEDLQSSNGTLLNDKPVTRRVLRDGDRVQIGKTVLVFHEGTPPGAAAAPAAAAAAASALDDNDLFGDAPTTAGSAAAPAPSQVPAPALEPRPAPPAARPERIVAPPPPPSPPPPPTRPAVVEFADEVVEVKKAAAPAAAAKPAGAAAPTVAPAAGRVLQFSKQAGGSGGLLGDDLGQMSGGMRALLVVGVLAAGAAIVWLVKGLLS